MSKILDDAYKALNWVANNTRPTSFDDYEKSCKMEKAIKAALDELKSMEQNDDLQHPEP